MGIAAQLLEEIDLRLGEIALRLGYRSEFSFSPAFKLARGVSPIQYRRAMPAPQSRAPPHGWKVLEFGSSCCLLL